MSWSTQNYQERKSFLPKLCKESKRKFKNLNRFNLATGHFRVNNESVELPIREGRTHEKTFHSSFLRLGGFRET